MTKVVSLYGGAGVGKSATAAGLYAHMKMTTDLNVELVREFVKSWAWTGRRLRDEDQPLLLGKQSQYESLLYGKVDYIVTDSPVFLAGAYYQYYTGNDYILKASMGFMKGTSEKGVERINFFINRNCPYNPMGRYETEEQAILIDQYIKDLMIENNIKFYELNEVGYNRITEIMEYIGNEEK